MTVLRKKFLFSCHLHIDKKINNVKEDPRRKMIQTLIFSKLPSAYEVVQEVIYVGHITKLFLHQKRLK